MKLRSLGAALVVALVLGAVMASSALAEAVTEDRVWNVEGVALSGSELVTSTGSTETVTKIGSTNVILKSSGLNCIGCQIKNSGGAAIATGKLEFTGVTVSVPNCAVSGGVIKTNPLVFKADYMEGATDYLRFDPESGTNIATVTIVQSGGACPVSGTYVKVGDFFGKMSNATGVSAVSQTVTFSAAINKAAGGHATFAGQPVEFNGTLNLSMVGAHKGQKFGVF